MNVETFINAFPGGKVGSMKDNQKILDFYHSFSMDGGVFKIAFRKGADFFKFLKYESPDNFVFLLENDDKDIEGMGSMIIRPCYLNGKVDKVAYVSDLRVLSKNKRKNQFRWRDFPLEICQKGKDVDEFNGCRYYLGAIVDANEKAKDVFDSLDAPFGASDISTYSQVNLLGRRPLKFFGKKSPVSDLDITITRAEEKDIPELKNFLDKQSRKKAFGFVYEGENGELDRRLKDWDDFSISSFYLTRNSSGKLISCFAPWDPTKGRRIVVDRFPGYLAFLGKILKGLGKSVPNPGDELKTLYMTTMEFDYELTRLQKKHILNEYIDVVYQSKRMKNYHVLAFCDYKKDSIGEGLEKNYFIQSTRTILYQVHDRDTNDPVIKEKNLQVPAGHELCLT
ncbi:MAG: hypothetical protein GY754_22925 [bacterium]|nr:hypothetical protein [bacterium]